jgi:hypothetical protein
LVTADFGTVVPGGDQQPGAPAETRNGYGASAVRTIRLRNLPVSYWAGASAFVVSAERGRVTGDHRTDTRSRSVGDAGAAEEARADKRCRGRRASGVEQTSVNKSREALRRRLT